MADLTLKGPLDLMGTLTFKPDPGGSIRIDEVEALVEAPPGSSPPQCSKAPPVLQPPPPSAPTQPQPTVWIVNSFNKTVKAGGACIVAQGMVMQGLAPSPVWPGAMLPSTHNATVTINGVPINVVGDAAVIFASGGSAVFDESGQP